MEDKELGNDEDIERAQVGIMYLHRIERAQVGIMYLHRTYLIKKKMCNKVLNFVFWEEADHEQVRILQENKLSFNPCRCEVESPLSFSKNLKKVKIPVNTTFYLM